MTYEEASAILGELLAAGVEDAELQAALEKARTAARVMTKAGADGGMCTGRGGGD